MKFLKERLGAGRKSFSEILQAAKDGNEKILMDFIKKKKWGFLTSAVIDKAIEYEQYDFFVLCLSNGIFPTEDGIYQMKREGYKNRKRFLRKLIEARIPLGQHILWHLLKADDKDGFLFCIENGSKVCTDDIDQAYFLDDLKIFKTFIEAGAKPSPSILYDIFNENREAKFARVCKIHGVEPVEGWSPGIPEY